MTDTITAYTAAKCFNRVCAVMEVKKTNDPKFPIQQNPMGMINSTIGGAEKHTDLSVWIDNAVNSIHIVPRADCLPAQGRENDEAGTGSIVE